MYVVINESEKYRFRRDRIGSIGHSRQQAIRRFMRNTRRPFGDWEAALEQGWITRKAGVVVYDAEGTLSGPII